MEGPDPRANKKPPSQKSTPERNPPNRFNNTVISIKLDFDMYEIRTNFFKSTISFAFPC